MVHHGLYATTSLYELWLCVNCLILHGAVLFNSRRCTLIVLNHLPNSMNQVILVYSVGPRIPLPSFPSERSLLHLLHLLVYLAYIVLAMNILISFLMRMFIIRWVWSIRYRIINWCLIWRCRINILNKLLYLLAIYGNINFVYFYSISYTIQIHIYV